MSFFDHFQSNSFAGCKLAAQNAHHLLLLRPAAIGQGASDLATVEGSTSQLCRGYQKEQP